MLRDNRFSNKLTWVQFILSVMVVVIHAVNYSPKLISQCTFITYLGEAAGNLGNIAVPCFLAISGFLFYWNFSWDKLWGKFKRRFFTLLVPFVVWNSLIYFAYLGLSQIPALHMEQMTFSVKGFLSAVIDSEYSPLWFIRTLVVYVLITPLIVWCWKKEWIAVLTITALIATNYFGISTRFISNYYLPMYLVGAYMALYHPDKITNRVDGIHRIVGTLGFVAICVIAALYAPLQLSDNWLYTLRWLGVLSVWFVLDWFSFARKPAQWMQVSFPIYVMHCVMVKVGKLLIYHYLPHAWWVQLGEYVLLTAIPVVLIILINHGLNRNRYTKGMWRFVMGNR